MGYQERPHAQQERQGGLEEAVQARTETPEKGRRMDGRCYEGPQRARHHRLLLDEPWSPRSCPVQEGKGALQLKADTAVKAGAFGSSRDDTTPTKFSFRRCENYQHPTQTRPSPRKVLKRSAQVQHASSLLRLSRPGIEMVKASVSRSSK